MAAAEHLYKDTVRLYVK